MIEYRRSSVRIAEVHFDPTGVPDGADVIRYQWQFRPVPGNYCLRSHTVYLDLRRDPEDLLARMKKRTRYEIRRAEQEDLAVEIDTAPTLETLRQFCSYFDRFARHKGLSRANRARLESMRRAGQLVLSAVLDSSGQRLVWQSGLRTAVRVRAITAASVRHTAPDPGLVGRANRFLYWREIHCFRELGIQLYDLGGWYVGTSDQEKLRINSFKSGFGGAVRTLYNTYEAKTWKGKVAVHLHRLRGGE